MDVRQALKNIRLIADSAESDDLELVREQLDMIRQIAALALRRDDPISLHRSSRRTSHR
jgi:hypothetical protein